MEINNLITEATLKKELHHLIDNCDNEMLLAEAKELLQSTDVKDWWDELTQEDKNLVIESETEYQKGNFISHKNLIQEFKEWKEK
ncbi:MAG: hypothetical protein M3R50_09045 [Bacteroidota bacterium]|nr:hypothetical protein [Bacteroidota bacterium]